MEITVCGADSHQVIVAFHCGTSAAAIEVRAPVVGACQYAVVGARERKHVYVIAVGGLTIQIVGHSRGSQWIQGQIEWRCRHRICLGGKRSLGGCEQVDGAAVGIVNWRFNGRITVSPLAALLAHGVSGCAKQCDQPNKGNREKWGTTVLKHSTTSILILIWFRSPSRVLRPTHLPIGPSRRFPTIHPDSFVVRNI